MRFRRKTVSVDAVQFTGHNGLFLEQWSERNVVQSPICEPSASNPSGRYVQVKTATGWRAAEPNDWIIRMPDGHFWSCSEDEFAKVYEPDNT